MNVTQTNASATKVVDYEKRLVRLFQKYSPGDVAKVPGLLKNFKGREAAMLASFVKKYGPEPTDPIETEAAPAPSHVEASQSPSSPKGATPVPRETPTPKRSYEERIVAMYQRYSPQDVERVPSPG